MPFSSTAPSGPNAVYCTTATAFQADLKQPPQLTIAPVKGAHAHRVSDIRFKLSKISNVSMTATYGGGTTSYGTLLERHGADYFTWRPGRAGAWLLTLTAVDLAGNRKSQTVAVTVAAARGR